MQQDLAMPPTLVANLDTSRISALVASSADAGARPLRALFENGDLHLAVCLARVLELAALSSAKRREVVHFLQAVPTLIGQPEDTLQTDELRNGCLRAVGSEIPRAPRAFARGTADWGTAINAQSGTAADLLELYNSQSPEARQLKTIGSVHVPVALEVGAAAAVVKDREVHLRDDLSRHLADIRARNPAYASGLDACEVIERNGGIAAFPTYDVSSALLVARLLDERHEANDLLDEDIATYHPYSAVSVLDRATANRFWRANVAGRERVTFDLSASAGIVERVRDGALAVHDHALPDRAA